MTFSENGDTTFSFNEKTVGTGQHQAFWNFDASVNAGGDWSMKMGGHSADDLRENRSWIERLIGGFWGLVLGQFG